MRPYAVDGDRQQKACLGLVVGRLRVHPDADVLTVSGRWIESRGVGHLQDRDSGTAPPGPYGVQFSGSSPAWSTMPAFRTAVAKS